MIDIGLSKMALIGAVALIVIGPEKLPRVARTVGTLLGKAQRYVSDVKAEVNRSMELDELKKMKDTVENAARDVHNTIQTNASEDWDHIYLQVGLPPGKPTKWRTLDASVAQPAGWEAPASIIVKARVDSPEDPKWSKYF